jgi:hypothetical protein
MPSEPANNSTCTTNARISNLSRSHFKRYVQRVVFHILHIFNIRKLKFGRIKWQQSPSSIAWFIPGIRNSAGAYFELV